MKLIQGADLSDRENQSTHLCVQALEYLIKYSSFPSSGSLISCQKSTSNVEIHPLYSYIILDDDFILVFSSIMYVELGLGISKLFHSIFSLALSVISDRHFTVKVDQVHFIVAYADKIAMC